MHDAPRTQTASIWIRGQAHIIEFETSGGQSKVWFTKVDRSVHIERSKRRGDRGLVCKGATVIVAGK